MAEQCLQHTREVLQKAHEHTEIINDEGPSTVFQDACGAINEIRDKVDEQFITKYASQVYIQLPDLH